MRFLAVSLFFVAVTVGSLGGCSKSPNETPVSPAATSERSLTEQERVELAFINSAKKYLERAEAGLTEIQQADESGLTAERISGFLKDQFLDLPEARHNKRLGLVRDYLKIIYESFAYTAKLRKNIRTANNNQPAKAEFEASLTESFVSLNRTITDARNLLKNAH